MLNRPTSCSLASTSRCISASSWLRQFSTRAFTSPGPAKLLCLQVRLASSSTCCSLERYLHVGQRLFRPRRQHLPGSPERRLPDLESELGIADGALRSLAG